MLQTDSRDKSNEHRAFDEIAFMQRRYRWERPEEERA
jgi:hypothetical protein